MHKKPLGGGGGGGGGGHKVRPGLDRVNKYIISLKLNKYNSLKLHKYTIAGCKIIPWYKYIFLNMNICSSWIMHDLQTANHSQLWVTRKQIQIMIY